METCKADWSNRQNYLGKNRTRNNHSNASISFGDYFNLIYMPNKYSNILGKTNYKSSYPFSNFFNSSMWIIKN